MKPCSDSPALETYLLGHVDFLEVQSLQRRLVYELGERGGACLVLCEHPPTISVGRSGSRAYIVPDDVSLRALGVKVHWVNRGGGCVLHLPGQLTAYFAMPLRPPALGLSGYLAGLEQAIIGVLDEFMVPGVVRPDHPGIFLGRARVASVGVAVNRWIAYHGFSLNVGPCLDLFNMLEEPGIDGSPLRQTSMESRLQRHVPMAKVREAIIRHLQQVFGLERHLLFTRHPLIRRKVLSHVYAPSPG
jgi:lipoyl(octanoyl) transferase